MFVLINQTFMYKNYQEFPTFSYKNIRKFLLFLCKKNSPLWSILRISRENVNLTTVPIYSKSILAIFFNTTVLPSFASVLIPSPRRGFLWTSFYDFYSEDTLTKQQEDSTKSFQNILLKKQNILPKELDVLPKKKDILPKKLNILPKKKNTGQKFNRRKI